jgi:hypothetical protein
MKQYAHANLVKLIHYELDKTHPHRFTSGLKYYQPLMDETAG